MSEFQQKAVKRKTSCVEEHQEKRSLLQNECRQCHLPIASGETLCPTHMGERRCKGCSRRLRNQCFLADSQRCITCERKKTLKDKMFDSSSTRASVNNTFLTTEINVPANSMDPLLYMRNASSEISRLLHNAMEIHSNIRWSLMIGVRFQRQTGEDIAWIEANFSSSSQILLNEYEIDTQIDSAFQEIMRRIEEFIALGSGWSVDWVVNAFVRVAAYNSIGGSSYLKTPAFIANTKATINIQNSDNRCFLYSIAAAIYVQAENPQRAHYYDAYINKFNVKGLEFPMSISQIDKFEAQNDSISVTVLHVDKDNCIVPLYVTKHRDRKHHVNLMLLTQAFYVDDNGAEQPCKEEFGTIFRSHYILIKSLSRLLYSRSKYHGKAFVCPYCLHRFSRSSFLDAHISHCSTKKPCLITFPSNNVKISSSERAESIERIENFLDMEDGASVLQSDKPVEKYPENILHFKAYRDIFQLGFCCYVDFETFCVDIKNDESTHSNTTKTKLHVPSGFAVQVVSSFEQHNNWEPFLYSGPDVMKHFFAYIREVHAKVTDILDANTPMKPLTDAQQRAYDASTACPMCKNVYTDANRKCRDHDHVTGAYRQPLCRQCNLSQRYRKRFMKNKNKDESKFVEIDPSMDAEVADYVKNKIKPSYYLPIIAHGMKNFDLNLIIKHLTKEDAPEIRVIASNREKFLCMDIGQLRFIDSFQFLPASLETLVGDLRAGGCRDDFLYMKRHFKDDKIVDLLSRKGIFCYDWNTGLDRFEATSLPPKEAFFNALTDEHVSDADYDFAKMIWEKLDMKIFKDYHDCYLMTDTLLLASVFENFRKLSLKNYQLDPCHYITLPSLSLSACLKMTDVKLELLTDITQLGFFESSLRGGVSSVIHRYSRANNKLIPETYDPTKPSTYLFYCDFNSLYPHCMDMYLPTGNFKWLTQKEMEQLALNLHSLTPEDEFGYFIECDLLYPASLHVAHNDFPLAVEKINITEDLLSPYTKKLRDKLGMKPIKNNVKLVPNLMDKKNYVCHSQNLQFYVKHGLRITKWHRALRFSQAPWMRPYIQFNANMRKQAATPFEKSFYKYAMNSVFGKLCENMRKRTDIKLVSNQQSAERFIARPTFETYHIINDDVTMVQNRLAKLKWMKPTYLGATILEYSKLVMYKHYYEEMVPRYGRNLKLMYMDTDSFIFEVTTPDLYADLALHADKYDFSDYSPSHFLHSTQNKKRLGFMKDELPNSYGVEFVAVRSKMYSLLTSDGSTKATAKGVNHAFAKKHLHHEEYRKCLFDESSTEAEFYTIASRNHTLTTDHCRKKALSCYDDKRFLIEGSTDTYALGHYKIALLKT